MQWVKRTVQSFRRLRALVVGDAMLDSYLGGSSHRLCQEAPVPIVDVHRRIDLPGGAGNCAVNIAALGARPILLSVVGADAEGDTLRAILAERGVSAAHVVPVAARRTLFKARILCDEHMVVRFDQGTTDPLEPAVETELTRRLEAVWGDVGVVVVSDYRYGILTPRIIARMAELQADDPKVVVVDSKALAGYRSLGMTACKPNYRQALDLLGLDQSAVNGHRCELLWSRGAAILERTGARITALTLDREGAIVFARGEPPYRTHARPAPQERAAGAGDTYLSTLALALGAGVNTSTAAELAAAAAAVVVGKAHTATCSAEELVRQVAGSTAAATDLSELKAALAEHRRHQRRIVLTNGCFDILHRGHIAYLEQAKRLGDVLIVGVNTDRSIRRLKGSGRPINRLADRMGVLSALACVDHVVAFGEDTPHRLIEAVRPDIFVKGGDYTRETLPEAELVEQLGGTVQILSLVNNRSTSGIIQRICDTYAPRPDGRCPQEGSSHGNPILEQRPAGALRAS